MKFIITAEAKAALCRQAPEFTPVVAKTELEEFECHDDLFLALFEAIVSQQLSGKAAAAIYGKLKTFLGAITAERLQAASIEALRSCGLSARKAEYLHGIAAAVLSGAIDFDRLAQSDDATVIAELVKLKGVGVWTAEMLLIFTLGRKDVLSYRDLGIRRGLMLLNRRESLDDNDFEFYRRRPLTAPSPRSICGVFRTVNDAGTESAQRRLRPRRLAAGRKTG